MNLKKEDIMTKKEKELTKKVEYLEHHINEIMIQVMQLQSRLDDIFHNLYCTGNMTIQDSIQQRERDTALPNLPKK